jgi:glycosyltransferase involved in cell wall biosynthesis
VDNRSPDDTLDRAREALEATSGLRWRLLLNDENVGLGGSHKVAIQHALREGHDHLIVLHGDDQASIDDIVPRLRAGVHRRTDAMPGARFMRGAQLLGYSRVRTIGNHVYNLVFSVAGRRRLHDLGSGLNLFGVARFADGQYLRFADDLTFNYHLSLWMAAQRWRIHFFPISWREEDQRSNVKLVQQGLNTLGLVADFLRDRDAFFARDFAAHERYTAQVVASSDPSP